MRHSQRRLIEQYEQSKKFHKHLRYAVFKYMLIMPLIIQIIVSISSVIFFPELGGTLSVPICMCCLVFVILANRINRWSWKKTHSLSDEIFKIIRTQLMN